MTQDSDASQAQGVTGEFKGAADDVAREARAAGQSLRQEVAGLGSTIKQGVRDQVDRQKNGIADRLQAVATRAHATSGELRGQEPWLGSLLGRGADELAGIAEEIRRNDVPGLLGSVEVFARRQPALFMGATVALGFAVTRFVASGPKPSDSYGDEIGQSVGGRAFEFARTPQAQPPMAVNVGGGPKPSDSHGDQVSQPVGGHAFDFARAPQAQRPIADTVGGRGNT